MERYCSTRLLKNAKFLQSPEIGYFPKLEPLDGFSSLVPASVLRRLEHIAEEEIRDDLLAQTISKRGPPSVQAKLAAPLFSGTLRFVQITFTSSGSTFAVPQADVEVTTKYSRLAIIPISEYCSQYGPNSLALAPATVPFTASVAGRKYNDSILSGWVDRIAKDNGFGADSCLVFLNPLGVVNTDADATQGVLGYHSISSTGVPYAFVNVMGTGLTIEDGQDFYALALSHELAEMDVDPRADGGNPEVCDPCAGNCGTDHRNYFDIGGNWLGGSATPGYGFFIDGIATPATVAQCPAPEVSCTYQPPKR